jgi:hypothetical protein
VCVCQDMLTDEQGLHCQMRACGHLFPAHFIRCLAAMRYHEHGLSRTHNPSCLLMDGCAWLICCAVPRSSSVHVVLHQGTVSTTVTITKNLRVISTMTSKTTYNNFAERHFQASRHVTVTIRTGAFIHACYIQEFVSRNARDCTSVMVGRGARRALILPVTLRLAIPDYSTGCRGASGRICSPRERTPTVYICRTISALTMSASPPPPPCSPASRLDSISSRRQSYDGSDTT